MENQGNRRCGYGVTHTLEETAQLMGITRERVRQIEKQALEKLRRRLKLRYGITSLADGNRFGTAIAYSGYETTINKELNMKKKKASLFEETKIQMVMNIFDISRSKAIEYIASRSTGGGQKTDGGSKSDRNIRSRNAGEWMSAEEFFADED